jgi:A/G-specific adenine glycosylase
VDDRDAQRWLWERAASVAAAGAAEGGPGAGVVNEALMELGATVCLPAPAMPRCGSCPLRASCAARLAGTQSRIPRPKAGANRRTVYCASAVVVDARGRVLLERRGDDGMWAGLWQAPTVERTDRAPTRAELARAVGLRARDLRACGGFRHLTTHREVEFGVFAGSAAAVRPGGRWIGPRRLGALGLSSAQRRVLSIGAGCVRTPTRSR